MKLALRTGAAPDASRLGRLSAEAIKIRLVTHYPHAGIVMGGRLYHATSRYGVIDEPFVDSDIWTLKDYGDDDAAGLERYKTRKGRRYDWFSLLAFAGVKASDSSRDYCYELAYFLKTGVLAKGRVTPEMLLDLAA